MKRDYWILKDLYEFAMTTKGIVVNNKKTLF
jgi:hypothetical protein